MMKYKMLVLDMDDTLLTDDHKISGRNTEMLLKAQKEGVYVVLASGRPTQAMLRYAYDLQLDSFNSYILSYNGAVITEMKGENILFKQCLSKEDIHDLYDFSQEHKVHIITYIDGAIVSETDSEYIETERRITGMPHHKVVSFKDAVMKQAVKCILLEDPVYLKTIETLLKKEMPHKSVATSKPFFLEVTQQGIDKAASLARLAERLSILPAEIISVGNAENDLSMIKYAGLGVWVNNVSDALRPKANVVVASNNDDGVAEVVERFILNRL